MEQSLGGIKFNAESVRDFHRATLKYMLKYDISGGRRIENQRVFWDNDDKSFGCFSGFFLRDHPSGSPCDFGFGKGEHSLQKEEFVENITKLVCKHMLQANSFLHRRPI